MLNQGLIQKCLLAAVCTSLIAPAAFCQFETAAVLGTVLDSGGAIIREARVTLVNQETGVTQLTATDSEGNYQFLEVRLGQYEVRVEAAGFKKAETAEFRVTVGARQRVNVTLEVGELTQTVDIKSSAAIVEQESSERQQVISQEDVQNLPLNGRDSAALALLAPGVRNSYALSKREASFNVNGLRSQFNNFTLDGVDNNAYGTSNQGLSNQVIQLSPDSLQEFSVITNTYSAEYGHVGGAVINASIRSGTNQVHGAAWEYLRNTDLNATGFFKPLDNQKPVYIQNQFGAAAGGPIKKNKAFIFVDYEGLRLAQDALTFASVPTFSQRNGVFTVPVMNPYTNAPYPNNAIPATDISSFASKVLGEIPLPNLSGNTNNYSSLLPSGDNSNKGDIRYDHYFSQKVTYFARYSYRLDNSTTTPNSAIEGPAGGGDISRVMNWQGMMATTWTISPTSLVEVRMSSSKTEGMKAPLSMGNGPSMFALYGITGLPTSPSLIGGLTDQDITGYESFGRDSQSPQWQNPLVYNPKVNYSKIIGRHTLKAGYEYQAIVTDLNDFNPSYGQDNYNGQFSNPTPTKSNTLYNLADFLVGARASYQLTNYTEAHLEQRMNFGYLQDDFRVSPRLTLNLGVRYEFATPQWERNNMMANFDPAINSLVYAQNGSIAQRALVNPQYKDWAPRAGLAYSLNSKTVIRAGYGISYVLFIRQGGDSYLAYNGPFVVNANISQQPTEGLCASAAQNTLNCFLPTQMGYPVGITSPSNFSTASTKTVYVDPTIRWPYVQNWDFTIQRELSKDVLLDVGYIGNHSVGDWVNEDLNQAMPNLPGQALPLAARRPDQQYAYVDSNFSAGFSSYDALQVKLEKRYSHGLTILNSFTWSKAIDNAAGALEMGNGDFQAINRFDAQAQKALSGYDQPLNDTFSVVYNVPVGRGLRYGSSMPSWLDAAAGGWIISGINTIASGEPINLTYDPNSAFIATDGTKNSAIYTPNITGDIYPAAGQQTIKEYFNPATVLVPTDVSHPYGNAGRNIGRSNALFNLDSGVHKQFPLWNESSKLEFRAEFFNTLNKTNFSPANGDRSSSSFGTITSTFPARQVQFALRVLF
jgi:hypothetical protein